MGDFEDYEESESQSLDQSSDKVSDGSEASLSQSLWEDLKSVGTSVLEKKPDVITQDGDKSVLKLESDIYNGDTGGKSAAGVLGDSASKDPGGNGEGEKSTWDSFKSAVADVFKSDTPEAQPESLEGKGEKSKDAKTDAVEPPKDAKFGYKLDDKGQVSDITVPDEKTGQPKHYRFSPDSNNFREWDDSKNGFKENGDNKTLNATVDKATGEVKLRPMSGGESGYDIHPNGKLEQKDGNGKVIMDVDAKGNASKHEYNKDGTETRTCPPNGEKPCMKETIAKGATEPSKYEFTDKNGHTETIDKTGDKFTVTRGDKKEELPAGTKVEVDANGDRKFTKPDGSTFEGKHDGSSIERDSAGRVTETKTADGTTTEFGYMGRDVNSVTVKDAHGKVVESSFKTGIGLDAWSTTKSDQLGLSQERIKDIKVNPDGSYKVELADGKSIDRKADGSERLKDSSGKDIPNEADKVLDQLKEKGVKLTEAQEKQLRSDLGDIDKMDPGKRQEIYQNLEKIASSNTDNTTKMSPEQRAQIVTDLAHQIAHPEAIKQGYKDTCVAANAEKTMAMKHPEEYAKMIAALTVDGKYETPHGKVVEVQKDANGKMTGPSDGDKIRTLTSEVFQTAAINAILPEGQTYKSFEPGHQPLPKGVDASTDTGDRIQVDEKHWYGDKHEEQKFNGLDSGDKEKMLRELMPGDHYASRDVNSSDDFMKAWNENGGNKNPPMNVGITLGNEGNFAGMGQHEKGTAGKHALSVTHVENGPPAMVYYENTAGGADHSYPNGQGVPVDQFVSAMKAAQMKAVVQAGGPGDGPSSSSGGSGGKEGAAMRAGSDPASGDAASKEGGAVRAATMDARQAVGAPDAGSDMGAMGDDGGKKGGPAEHGDQAKLKQASDDIYDACTWHGNDDEKVMKALEGKTPEQLARMDEQFKKDHGKSIEEYLKDEMKRHPDKLAEAQKLLHPDTGTPDKDHPNVKKDAQGRMTEFASPDGTNYKFTYNRDGSVASMTVAKGNEEGTTFLPKTDTRTDHGKKITETIWVDRDNPKNVTEGVNRDPKTGEITISVSPDGSNFNFKTLSPDGTFKHKEMNGPGYIVEKPGAPVSEIVDEGGKNKGYQIKDTGGHTTTVEVGPDGKAVMNTGDQKEEFAKVEKQANGDLKLTRADNSTVEVKSDGSMVSRDKDGHVSDTKSVDGTKTHFERDAKGNVTSMRVTDAQGQGVALPEVPKTIQVDDKDGSYKATFKDGSRVEHKADGTEKHFDKAGNPVETGGDKLLKDVKGLNPEQQKQLERDLADINKLPPEQRQKVLDSLEKVAKGDAATKLTDAQRAEIVSSLAHQIAHPESIKQGHKMTCVLANSEQTLARNHPEVYADMVAKLATDGKYTTADGKTVEAQKDKDGHLMGKTDAYGQRSASSELFENAAAQLAMKPGDTYKSYPPGAPELRPFPPGVSPSTDGGERVVHKDGSTEKFNGLDASDQAKLLNSLVPSDKYGATEPISSPAQLEKALTDNGGPPLNVGIHLGAESKFTGMTGNEAASQSGYHAVNITRIETLPDGKKVVYYENPAGGTDHSYPNGKGVPIDDFVKAMQGGDQKMRAVVKGAGGGDGKPSGSMGAPMGAMAGPEGGVAVGDTAKGAMGAPNSGAESGILKGMDTADAAASFNPFEKLKKAYDDYKKDGSSDAKAAESKEGGTGDAKPPTAADQSAKDLHDAVAGLGTDEEKIYKTLEGKTPEQIAEIKKAYKDTYKVDLETDLRDDMSGSELQKALDLLNGKKDAGDANKSEGREKLEKLADKITDPTEKENFKKDIEKFENRQPPVSPEQKAEFYKEMARLMESPDGKFDAGQRIRIAEQVLHQAADPKSVDQGQHSTCGAASAESMIYTTNPAQAAKMVADVAITGEFKDKTGKTVKPDPETLKRIEQGGETYPAANGKQSMASHIFQTTAVTMEYANYKQRDPQGPQDTGEYLEGSKFFKEPDKQFDGLYPNQVVDINKRITGEDISERMVLNFKDKPDPVDGQTYVASEQDLNNKLKTMKLPATIQVDTNQEPFFTDSGGGTAGGSGAKHYVTITGYEAGPPAKVSIDNQWGSGADHQGEKSITVGELYRATLNPGDHKSIEELKAQVEQNKKDGKVDPAVDLELLRQKHMAKDPADKISDADYAKKVEELSVAYKKHLAEQEKQGMDVTAQKKSFATQMGRVLLGLPPAQQQKILKKVAAA